MRLAFVDTGALYALADRTDQAHGRARAFHESSKVAYLTTDFVLAETMSLITKRVGKKQAVTFGEALRSSPRFRIEDASIEIRKAAWKEFASRMDKNHDLIDCISFAMMEAYEVEEVFGFDRHFAQRGFKLVPGR